MAVSCCILLRIRCFMHKLQRKSKPTLCSLMLLWRSYHVWGNVEKYGRAGQATGNIIWCICFIRIQLDVLTMQKWQSVPTPVPTPWNKHTKTITKKPMAVHYSCASDDGRMWCPKHVELETFQEKRYCTSSWIRIKHMLPRCTEPQTLHLKITWCICLTCQITKATDTFGVCNT
jgi:hypothetical protein